MDMKGDKMGVCTKERFLNDVETHEMTIIRDDDTARHIRFKRPGSMYYFFDIITWPGHLCISGDCGTYVFARVSDMFEFFRHPKNELSINTGYWHEKMLAQDRHRETERYSEELFREAVVADFDSFFEDYMGDIDKDDCWQAIEDEVFVFSDTEYDACLAVRGFSYEDFSFDDFFEHELKEYTFSYLWNLYAIVWGIQKYDGE